MCTGKKRRVARFLLLVVGCWVPNDVGAFSWQPCPSCSSHRARSIQQVGGSFATSRTPTQSAALAAQVSLDDSEQQPQRVDPTTATSYSAANDTRYSAKDWFHNIKSLPRSSILKSIRGPVISIMVWSFLVSVLYKGLQAMGYADTAQRMCISSTPYSFLVSSLGLLLVFRTNSAYQRFAEGRMIWEKILSVSRSMSRMARLYENDLGSDRKRRVCRLLAAFPYLLWHHIDPQYLTPSESKKLEGTSHTFSLHDPSSNAISTTTQQQRGEENRAILKTAAAATPKRRWVDRRSLPWCLLPQIALKKCTESPNRPLWICDRLSQELTNVPYSPNFTSRERLTFLSQVDKLSTCIGECERIHQTAVPLNYARHSLRSLTLWLFGLPFGLIQDLGLLTGPVMGAIAWVLLGVYQIGYTIEDPFQGSLRLIILCDAIYRDVMMLYDDKDMDSKRETAFEIQKEELDEWNAEEKVSAGSNHVPTAILPTNGDT